jgi:hypothetical protein
MRARPNVPLPQGIQDMPNRMPGHDLPSGSRFGLVFDWIDHLKGCLQMVNLVDMLRFLSTSAVPGGSTANAYAPKQESGARPLASARVSSSTPRGRPNPPTEVAKMRLGMSHALWLLRCAEYRNLCARARR